MMVRKANTVHQSLCVSIGFKIDDTIFEKSAYIRQIYDDTLYIGFTL